MNEPENRDLPIDRRVRLAVFSLLASFFVCAALPILIIGELYLVPVCAGASVLAAFWLYRYLERRAERTPDRTDG